MAATFRVTGVGRIPKAPKGFRVKITPTGPLFIERRGLRLSKLSEVLEIQSAKAKAPKLPKLPKIKLSLTSRKKKKKGIEDFF